MKRLDVLVYKDVKRPFKHLTGNFRQNKSLSWRRLTVLANVYADGVDVGEVGGLHGGAGGPHVVEEEDWHGGEAKHAQPGHAQNVRQEDKLQMRTHNTCVVRRITATQSHAEEHVCGTTCAEGVNMFVHTIPLMQRPQMVVLNSL